MKRVLQSRLFSSKPSRFPGAALSLEHVRLPQQEPNLDAKKKECEGMGIGGL